MPEDAARRALVVRRFRGHRRAGPAPRDLVGMAPEEALRLVAVTTDLARLPADSTWYLLTNLPHPDVSRAATSPIDLADLAEFARL